MESRRCDIRIINVQRASFAKQLRSKKHLENEKQDEMIIPERLFKERVENKIKKMYINSNPQNN